eukprot:1208315-Alexandrium_andersonii.AAC.1
MSSHTTTTSMATAPERPKAATMTSLTSVGAQRKDTNHTTVPAASSAFVLFRVLPQPGSFTDQSPG